MQARSPFLLVENFISPLTCEDIVSTVSLTFPETDEEGRPNHSVIFNRLVEIRLHDYLADMMDMTEDYYGVELKGMNPLEFEWYPEECKASAVRCENSTYGRGEWVRTNNRDFVGILFLNDYQEKAPFDPDFEVRGGKLQFPSHGFGFNPKRGMLVIFPGTEHFVNNTSEITAGELHQVRISMAAERPYVYNKDEFPGNYNVWF